MFDTVRSTTGPGLSRPRPYRGRGESKVVDRGTMSPGVVGGPQNDGALGNGGRTECGAGLVQELIAEPRHRAGDHRALGVGQVGLGGEVRIQLAAKVGIGGVAELAKQRPGVSPAPQGGQARGRLALNDQASTIDLRVPALEVLLCLGAEVVNVIEHDLF